MATGLRSSIHGDLVDKVSFDEAGRMTALRLPAAGGLWRTQSYYPWTVKRNGGMLESLKVGLSEGGGERLSRGYAYNSFGDITALTEETTSNSFTYDGLGRLTSAYGRTYSYDAANRLTSVTVRPLLTPSAGHLATGEKTYNYYDSGPYHAVDRIAGADRFDYDANGNMVKRNKGLSDQQTLVWDAENRLSQVQDNNGDQLEQYWYEADGGRVKKVSGTTTTYTFFGHYEEEVVDGTTTAISHYSFGVVRVAVKRGNTLYHLHGDHLGSTSLTTDGSTVEAGRAYYAYGSERSSSGDLQTDRTFTGQKRDATGLMYYNARYYDPALGTFISPDSMVPNPASVIDHNRFLYARGNPLKYTDPTGYSSHEKECSTQGCWEREFYWKDRWYRAHGYRFNKFTNHWTTRLWGGAEFADREILDDVLAEAGTSAVGTWDFNKLKWLAKAVVDFGNRIGPGIESGFDRLKALLGGSVTWDRAAKSGEPGTLGCPKGGYVACASGSKIEFYDSLFGKGDIFVRGIVVHELAHVIDNNNCASFFTLFCRGGASRNIPGWNEPLNPRHKRTAETHYLTEYASTNRREYWAEAVAIWVYGSAYKKDRTPKSGTLSPLQTDYIEGILRP